MDTALLKKVALDTKQENKRILISLFPSLVSLLEAGGLVKQPNYFYSHKVLKTRHLYWGSR